MLANHQDNEIEIAVRVSNEPGALGRLVSTMAAGGARIIACRSDHDHNGAVVQLITENCPGIQRELTEAGFTFETRYPAHA
jgi:hypothetical protein